MVTEEASVAEIAVWPITFLVNMFTAVRGSVLFSFAITAAGIVQRPKKSPRTSSTVQIIFSFWSFEFCEGILRNQKIIIGLDLFSNQCLKYLAPFGLY